MPEWKTLLDQAIEASADSAKELDGLKKARPDNSQITALLEALSGVDKRELSLDNLFPEGVPTDEQFFERLFQLRIALGFGQPEGEIVAIVASAAVGLLAEEDRSLILLGIADVSTKNLSLRLEIFPQLIRDHDWPLALLSKVFLVASDKKYQGNSGYDRAVQAMAKCKPEHSFALIKEWSRPPTAGKGAELAQFLLGLLRLNDLEESLRQKVTHMDAEIQRGSPQHRILYMRSLIPTAWSQGMTDAQLAYLQGVFQTGDPREQAVAFGVISHLTWCTNNIEAIFQKCVDWLEVVVNERLSPECKLAVVVLVHNASFWAKGGFLEAGLPRLAELWLKIIPVDSKDKVYWDGVDMALHDLIEKNFAAFRKVFVRLVEVEGKKLINAINDNNNQQNRMLLYSLRQRDCVDLVQDLLLSKHRRARRVGLFLYDELDIPIIEQSRLAAEGEERLLLLLLELRLHHVSGLGQARLLVSFLSQTGKCSPDFNDELIEDLILLGKDIPGTVLEFFKSLVPSAPLLQEALDKISQYFDGLKESATCPALKMSIPGYARATELFAKRFSRQVSEAVEKNSIFAQMTSKMILLYAHNHSSYQHGKLHPPEALQNISHSQESPRISVIAPESQAFRRLVAQNWIHRIEQGTQ